jgi:hypothetical protein
MPIELRNSDPDTFVITYRGEFSDDELEGAFERMTSELQKARTEGRRVAMISIGTADSGMTPKQRRRSADWLKERTELLRIACIGQAIVLPGTLQRGVLTAILWMAPYPVPLRVCATEAEAVSYVRSLF